MSSHTLPIENRLTPEQIMLTDEIGNEVYASHYAERKLSRFIIGTETVLLLGAFGPGRRLHIQRTMTSCSRHGACTGKSL